MSQQCRKSLFAETILKQCSSLRSLTIGCECLMGSESSEDIAKCAGGILDALSNVKREKQFNDLEELKIDARYFAALTLPLDAEILFAKIRNLDLILTVLHVPIVILESDITLMQTIQDILESLKKYLVSLVLPHFWETSEIQYFPQMKFLKELQTSVNFKLPLMELHQKVPVLKVIHFSCGWTLSVMRYITGSVNNGLSRIETQLSENLVPCQTVSELHLNLVHNVEMLVGFSKLFPDIKYLKIDLKSEYLQNLWLTWPKIQELSLAVPFDIDAADTPIVERFLRIGINVTTQTKLDSDPTKFHAGLIGMTVDETEALLESSVPFLSLNIKHYGFNLPSIRDLQELKKLTLKSGMVCNVGLMLGILPMKTLTEVEITSSDVTIDCVQHILKSNPHIKRWSFGGYGYNDSNVTVTHLKSTIVNWKIASKYNAKVEPAYKKNEYEWSQSSVVSSLLKRYGRGKCLYTSPYHVRPTPDTLTNDDS